MKPLVRSNLLAAAMILLPLHTMAESVAHVPLFEAVERHLPQDGEVMQWVQDPAETETLRGDELAVRETVQDELETIKLAGLVPPIRFESGVADIPEATIETLAGVLDRMKRRRNVRLHLVGHADDQVLSRALAEIYGDNEGLSRERAGEVAEHFQKTLGLPPESISWEWAGATRPVASNETLAGRALNRRVEVEVWYDEVKETAALEEFLVPHEIRRVKVCRMETLCKLRYVDGRARRARIRNLVEPLRYADEGVLVDPAFITRIRQTLDNLADKHNVVVRFVGHTDDVPLEGRLQRIYGDHLGLSRARARRVALSVQDDLALPSSAVESIGKGHTNPVASNDSTRGRGLNRRVEVEFWYDDPLERLPDEPQLCPQPAGAERVTRIYAPPWGEIEPIGFAAGEPIITERVLEQLERALGDIGDRYQPRLRFIGYTRNERLARRTAAVYGDDIGLSASRARRAMEQVVSALGLTDTQVEYEGRGYVHADDVVVAGFVQGETSHVAVRAVYDEEAVLDDYDGVDITRLAREIRPENPLGLNLMRITVDGKPLADTGRSSADIQRCTDVAMHDADIRFGFDTLRSSPRLNVAVSPQHVPVHDAGTAAVQADEVDFRMYANYSHFIERAEVRILERDASPHATPIAIIPVDEAGFAHWNPPAALLERGLPAVDYLLRAYDGAGNFDETRRARLWFVAAAEEVDAARDSDELLAAWGDTALEVHNIQLGSGTVSVRGEGVGTGNEIRVAGRPVPVDGTGRFAAEEVLPDGRHTVEVAVTDDAGNGKTYLRDLQLETRDWFYVGMADVTIAGNQTSGPADLLQGTGASDPYMDGTEARLAFFVDGKFGDGWRLTASADSRENTIGHLFDGMMDKSPQALFRRIDPDYHYPTYGDDATVGELAPTMGRAYLRVSHGGSHAQWGSFQASYMNNELARIDRALYGASTLLQASESTRFGERRFAIDAFAAEAGTVAAREEFRGTGGSLYFLERQDIVPGSERVRIEIRDKATGLVTGTRELVPVLDYDIDYLQGRVMLAAPLASTADDGMLVRTNTVSGDEAHLVVRYEHTPGFDDLDALAIGGQAHYWFGDHVKVGITSSISEGDEVSSGVDATDLTLRLSAGSWIKVQQARSEGLVSTTRRSADGGYQFEQASLPVPADEGAGASRIDIAVDSNDIFGRGNSRLTLYAQTIGAGFSAPGLTSENETDISGGALQLPVGSNVDVRARLDRRDEAGTMGSRTAEVNVDYRLSRRWSVSAGYRHDEINAPESMAGAYAGERSDAVVQFSYDPSTHWRTHAFVQDTIEATGVRQENGRVGVGGSFRWSEKLELDMELSDGDLGPGGRVGTNYRYSENGSIYVSYALENERTDLPARTLSGAEGNLTAGIRTRLTDSTSVFAEERYQHGSGMAGLTHVTGVDFVPDERWRMGLTTDIGTLLDRRTGEKTERVAGGLSAGLHLDIFQWSAAVEYRNDTTNGVTVDSAERTTWLFRNDLKLQLDASTRLLGKFNHSKSTSSLGTFYEGGFTEAVLGWSLRPVNHDRLNALVKLTWFYNLPTADQLTLAGIPAEFAQKSRIISADVNWDVTRRATLGGKYAWRSGEVAMDREASDFFGNDAALWVLRGDYDVAERWEVLIEGRRLDMMDLDERKTGALVSISRRVGQYFKVSVGYNFTDFSDDLTDLSYDNHGFFLNLNGSL